MAMLGGKRCAATAKRKGVGYDVVLGVHDTDNNSRVCVTAVVLLVYQNGYTGLFTGEDAF